MSLKRYLPTLPQVSSELVAVLLGSVGAAFVISQFPKLQRFVQANSVQLVASAESQDPPVV